MPVKNNTYKYMDPVLITKGNTKLGKIANISLPPIISCPPGVPCAREGCYSLKAWRVYKQSVRPARMHNWSIWKKEPLRFFEEVKKYIDKHKPLYMRWHPDGDIPNQFYLDGMIRVAAKSPNTFHLAFTKNYNLDTSDCPNNLTIIRSAWPGYDLPGHIKECRLAWLNDPKNPENRIEHAYFKCSGHCEGCFDCWHIRDIGKDVVFDRH